MANPNLGSGARAMEQAIENCKANIKWMERNEGPISEWLTEVTSGPIEPPEPIDVRLPLNVYPLHYNLELKPDFYGPDPEAFSFEGKVEVFVECRVATNRIVLHVNKLTIEEGTVRLEKMGADGNVPDVVSWEEDKVRQFLIIHLSEMLTVAQTYVVKMSFHGPLRPDLVGLYLSSYKLGDETR